MKITCTTFATVHLGKMWLCSFTLSCMVTILWEKYLTFNILHHFLSSLPLSDLGTFSSNTMIYIFTDVTLMQTLLIMTIYSHAIW